jgi:hypothetical protein
MLNEVGDWLADTSTNGSSASVAVAECDPRQGLLIRDCVRENHRFWKGTSLNPTLFQGRPSPVAEIAEQRDRDGWRGGRFIHGTGAWRLGRSLQRS